MSVQNTLNVKYVILESRVNNLGQYCQVIEDQISMLVKFV